MLPVFEEGELAGKQAWPGQPRETSSPGGKRGDGMDVSGDPDETCPQFDTALMQEYLADANLRSVNERPWNLCRKSPGVAMAFAGNTVALWPMKRKDGLGDWTAMRRLGRQWLVLKADGYRWHTHHHTQVPAYPIYMCTYLRLWGVRRARNILGLC